MSPAWPRHSSFILTYASMTIWHPSTDKGSVGSSTIHQGTLRVMAIMWQIIGIETSVPALSLQWWPMNLLQPLSAMVWESLENSVLDNCPWTKSFFGSSGFQWRSPSMPLKEKNANLNALEGEIRGTIWFYLHHPFPKQPSSGSRDTVSSWPVICPTGERECLGRHLTSLHAGCYQEGPFLSYSIQSHWFKNYVTRRQEESGRAAYKNLGEH